MPPDKFLTTHCAATTSTFGTGNAMTNRPTLIIDGRELPFVIVFTVALGRA